MSLGTIYTRMSLLATLFMTFHATDDVLRDADNLRQGGLAGLSLVLFLVVWLYGILRLPERRSGYIIGLLGSLGLSFVATGHLTGIGGDATLGEIMEAGPFFVWAVFGLAVTAFSSLIFSAYGLFFPNK